MCDICPGGIELVKFLIYGVFFIALIVFLITKKLLLGTITFLVSSNIVFFLEAANNSLWFRGYHVEWIQYFSLFVWPVISISLIIWYVRKKK